MSQYSFDLGGHKILAAEPVGDGRTLPPLAAAGLPKEAQDLMRLVREGHSIAVWIYRYLKDEVAGIQAPNTLRAKTGDLTRLSEILCMSVAD